MPGSDKTSVSSGDIVRSEARFRQNDVTSVRYCLKSCQVRTKQRLKREILSEVKPGSDKTSVSSGDIVRSEARFGQNDVTSVRNCLKSCQVQTKLQFHQEILSEVKPGSDKTTPQA
ncbi:hypothetical protein [Bacillus sp. ISL-55]|uniref:hypothetical protein n=1 Tax=Bacillus sp. ISL-55 TaxID=2819134 RepID=UPI001BE96E4C|nr:hypothetical protein [Bacillus sp. ISL-55]MBT2695802.1 hypothetical protein [Bacillus sp. ISL-55]